MDKVIKSYNFNEYITDINKLAECIDKLNLNNLVIAGVARGGLIPAVFLSHRLKTPHAFVQLTPCDMAKHEGVNTNLIVVDEILDTSNTFSRTIQWLSEWDWKQIYFVTLHGKAHHDLKPLTWKVIKKVFVITAVPQIPEDIYIEYPWE